MNRPNFRRENANGASGNNKRVLVGPRLSVSSGAAVRLLPLISLCLLAACSKGASTAQAAGASTTPNAAAHGSASANPCDVITAADVASILTAPATRKPGVDSVQCMYQTQSHATVRISVEKGDDAKGAWMLATTYNATKNPLPGIGDEALYNPEGAILIARKGDRSCRVDVVGYDSANGMDVITKDRGEALARKLGALCNKLLKT
jgi:hypothetical protein